MITEHFELTHADGSKSRLQLLTEMDVSQLSEKAALDSGFRLVDDKTWVRPASPAVVDQEIARVRWASPVVSWQQADKDALSATMAQQKLNQAKGG